MAISAHVFRWSLGDCTNDGISKHADQLMVLNAGNMPEGDELLALIGPAARYPACLIVPGNLAGCIKAVPVLPFGEAFKPRHGMMGGNFLHSSDARFCDACDAALAASYKVRGVAVGLYPSDPEQDKALAFNGIQAAKLRFSGAVPIHDRFE